MRPFGFQEGRETLALVSAAAGVLIEFIASIFFWLYSRTIRQLKDYHDSLLRVQNLVLAFRIVETTENADIRAEMSFEMLRYLVDVRGDVLHPPRAIAPAESDHESESG
jgi:hypothetical protein